MSATWFFRSRGQHREGEYVWHAPDAGSAADAQAIIGYGYRGTGCLKLMNPERPSMMLFYGQRGQLALLVTGLIPAGNPVDFQRRPIRITLLGVADDNDESACHGLVAIAVAALRGELERDIPISYGSAEGKRGFKVDAKKWSAHVDQAAKRLNVEANEVAEAESRYVYPDTHSNCDIVAKKITALCLQGNLPKLAGRVLILRTNMLDLDELAELQPWRTVSDVVDNKTRLPGPPRPQSNPFDAVTGAVAGGIDKAIKAAQARGIPPFATWSGLALVPLALLGLIAFLAWPPPPAGQRPQQNEVSSTTQSTVLAWGQDDPGGTAASNSTPVSRINFKLPAHTRVVAVRAGADFSLVLTSAHKMLAWGGDAVGQLGNGTTVGSTKPFPVALPPKATVTQISAGCGHSLALTASGSVLAWGDNTDGQLGLPANKPGFADTPVPLRWPGGATAKAVSAGCSDSLVLTSAGQVLAWGDNNDGQLGDGTTTSRSAPVAVKLPRNKTVQAISAGCAYNLALTTTGQIYAWGDNRHGQLGDGSSARTSDRPVKVKTRQLGTGAVTSISAGCDHGLALTSSGAVLAWGSDRYGQLGNNSKVKAAFTPVEVALSGIRVGEICAGDVYSLVLTTTGRLLAWGRNNAGQLGGGTAGAISRVPVHVDQGGVAAALIGAGPGADHSLAVARTGTARPAS
jgi:alpha-tubulin suppressor-like RCC1 family protein